MTEMQKQFEEWCCSKPLKRDKNEVGLYKYVSTDYAWQAWQASREALVVRLPDNIDFPVWVSGDVIDGYKSALGDVRDALDAAGVSYE